MPGLPSRTPKFFDAKHVVPDYTVNDRLREPRVRQNRRDGAGSHP
jgi:hypothetical protein